MNSYIIQKLNFKNAIISINSRQVLFDILAKSAIEKDQNSVLQSLDKIGKIGEDQVAALAAAKNLSTNEVRKFLRPNLD